MPGGVAAVAGSAVVDGARESGHDGEFVVGDHPGTTTEMADRVWFVVHLELDLVAVRALVRLVVELAVELGVGFVGRAGRFSAGDVVEVALVGRVRHG